MTNAPLRFSSKRSAGIDQSFSRQMNACPVCLGLCDTSVAVGVGLRSASSSGHQYVSSVVQRKDLGDEASSFSSQTGHANSPAATSFMDLLLSPPSRDIDSQIGRACSASMETRLASIRSLRERKDRGSGVTS